MSSILGLLLTILFYIIDLLIVVIIVQVVLSWLISFQVVSAQNQFVSTVWRLTRVITDPLLKPIRRIMPPVQGFDFSPMVLLLILYLIQNLLPRLLYGF